jgi:hypothetical protein
MQINRQEAFPFVRHCKKTGRRHFLSFAFQTKPLHMTDQITSNMAQTCGAAIAALRARPLKAPSQVFIHHQPALETPHEE